MIGIDTQNFLEQFGSKFELPNENGFNLRFDFILEKKIIKRFICTFQKELLGPNSIGMVLCVGKAPEVNNNTPDT